MNKYIEEGGNPKDLIEPVDGFHPGQKFHAMLADWLWNAL